MLFETALRKVKQFYIDQLLKTNSYQNKELLMMTISELKDAYHKEVVIKP